MPIKKEKLDKEKIKKEAIKKSNLPPSATKKYKLFSTTEKLQHCTSNAGRKLTISEKAPKIIESLRQGNTKSGACAMANITLETFGSWIRQGTRDIEDGVETEFSLFSVNVTAAIEESNAFALSCWRKHMPEDWRASMAYLERRDRDNYCLKQSLDITQTVEVSQKSKLELPDNGRRDTN